MMSSTKEDITMIELPPSEILDKLLTVAIDASRQAGDIILGNSGGADVLKSKANSRDLLTLIDPLCEKVRDREKERLFFGVAFITTQFLNSHAIIYYVHTTTQTIRETILATFPTHQFLGEEDVPPGKEASAAAIEAKLKQLNDADDNDNYLWIVDPIVSI